MVSWRRGSRDSALHYWGDQDSSRTLCGVMIPADLDRLDPGDGLQCENCAIMRRNGTPQKTKAERRQAAIDRDRRIMQAHYGAPPARAISPITGRAYPDYLEPADYPDYDESQRMARERS